jgi:hypothetical protein
VSHNKNFQAPGLPCQKKKRGDKEKETSQTTCCGGDCMAVPGAACILGYIRELSKDPGKRKSLSLFEKNPTTSAIVVLGPEWMK